jgi:subtilase family serine protease/ribosomal protein L40E
MSSRAATNGKALTLLIVWTVALGGLLTALFALSTPAQAGPCDQVGGVITGDWTITTVQVCTGIVYTVDGTININAGGSLTLIDGGLSFAKDGSHTGHALNINAGGTLVLDHSIVTTQTVTISPFLYLAVNVNSAAGSPGTFVMRNDASLKFPGWFNATGGGGTNSVINITDSLVTGFATEEISSLGLDTDDNDDGPTITWSATTASLFRTRIERMYEHDLGTGRHMNLGSGTSVYAYDTFVGVDHSNVAGLHNEMQVDGSSNAYLYNVTIDTSENPSLVADWQPAFRPTAPGGSVHFLRWLHATAVDPNGTPAEGATIWSRLSPSSTTAQYPDNGLSSVPTSRTLWYLGRAASGTNQWNRTNASGQAQIPLYTDQITTATLPNAESFGNYEQTATFVFDSVTYTTVGGVAFDPYPELSWQSNNQELTLAFSGFTLPQPDLVATGAVFNPSTPLEGDNVTITVTVQNQGPGGSPGFHVIFHDNVEGTSTFLADRAVAPLASGASAQLVATWANVSPGQHSIRVHVDAFDEAVESIESNNIRFFSISVTPLGPDLTVGVSFDPNPGFVGNTVRVLATVVNNGAKNATNFLVEFREGTVDSSPVYTVEIASLENSTVVEYPWVPPTTGDFVWYAVVDPDNRIPEPPPYREDDNVGTNTINIVASPNLQVFGPDLVMSDPFPRVGQTVTPTAVVRNTGQADALGTFRTDFFVDDAYAGSANVTNLNLGASTAIASGSAWTIPASACGYHTLRAVVDAGGAITEGALFEQDNTITSTVQVFPATVTTWSFSRTLAGVVSVSGSIEISGQITILDGGIYVDQQDDLCSRAYVKILPGGSLALVNARIWSNFPLVVYVSGTGSLAMSASSRLELTQRGTEGILRSGGTSAVTIRDSLISGQTILVGDTADLYGDTFQGSTLYVDTSLRSNLWDAGLAAVTRLALLTDDGSDATVDLDIRNTTFDQTQTSQMRFGGSQNVQLTSVVTYDPTGTWWAGMITQGATVSRYWWLTLQAVDGTGTILAGANVSFDLSRVDPNTLLTSPAPNPGPDDVYFTSDLTWPLDAPLGLVVYRAFAESRTALAGGRLVDNSYVATATAFLDGTTHVADGPASGQVTSDTTFDLAFSGLTPDLTVSEIRVTGGNGVSLTQPINTQITLTAVIRNSGQTRVLNVLVSFFADNVDKNNDGLLDQPASELRSVVGIADVIAPVVPANGTAEVSAIWMATGTIEVLRAISVVVDPPSGAVTDGGAVRETNELNNIQARSITLFTWPDLSVSSADLQFVNDPVVDNEVEIRVTVRNLGTGRATGARVVLREGGADVSPVMTFDLNNGAATTISMRWRPATTGTHTITVLVSAANDTIRNRDYVLSNNAATFDQEVLSQPDLELRQSDYVVAYSPNQEQGFVVSVRVYNIGQTPASNVSIAVFLDGNRAEEYGRTGGVNVGTVADVDIDVQGIATVGNHTLLIVADPDNRLNEGGAAQEANNFANITVQVQPPQGTIILSSPLEGTVMEPGNLFVSGYVRDTDLAGIAGVDLTIAVYPGTSTTPTTSVQTISQDGGFFAATIPLAGAADGSYRVVVSSPQGLISQTSSTFTVHRTLPFLDQPVPVLGIPWWLLLLILAAAAALAIGMTVYFKLYGLGKMVECGECGAFIPEDATTCPKCGVEFEKDMAKCSNCQAWIPVDVKQCPECGVEFATGEVEMADYQGKMRLQYDEVVQKFKEEASRQLGRTLSDREFQEWWRKQPTFLTFEDWLREEEEMRKMGSKPCPVCGTLNSVTATVCHKCGSLMRDTRPPGGGGGGATPTPIVRKAAAAGAPETPAAPQASPYAPPGGSAAPPSSTGTEAIPRRVIRRPATVPSPVIQKKVLKRPLVESESSESTEAQSGSEDKPDEDL